ncbi:MAG TPA: hypothetical protein VHJ76_03690 [Actinomycetota bacterium]|nr:hypothetical protein [Actinomycetota bacterium]
MRRRMAVLLAGSIIATTIGLAAPARGDVALWPLTCLDDGPASPGLQTAYIDSEGRLVLNPEAAPGDVDAHVQWLPDKLLGMYPCLVAPIFTDAVVCTYQKVLEVANSMDPVNLYLRYVYPNPNGPGYVVDHPRMLDDASDLVTCHLTT